jgi:peptidyl-prolyl cis-trans isomerase C
MGIRNRLLGAVAALAAAGLAACGGEEAAGAAAAAAADPSAVAAVVNNQPIYVSDVELEARVQGVLEDEERLEVDSAEFNEILDQLIDIKLLAIEAVGRGLDQEPESRHRLETARDNILGNILVDRVVEERVDEAAIRKMYESQVAIWELGDEAHIRHIVTASKDDLEKILAELKGGADFAVVASRKSIDEGSRMEGGDLGYMTEDEATPEFAKVIRETPTGGVSKPFQTDMGWHVARIDDRRKEKPPSIEELRGPILKHLTMMQIGDVLKELRQEAKIEKQTSPRNSTLDVESFSLPPEREPQLTSSLPPSFEASAPASPAPETRGEQPAAVTPPKSADAASPAPKVSAPKSTATAPAAAPSPPPAPQPSGPVSESREGETP